ncbi:isotrichodermin C-15 hydroxylase [Xylariaceae sp. FL1651]|nr:isotrichodermin C-15 hydroxylase [Xylariaceae sp. FL1651]
MDYTAWTAAPLLIGTILSTYCISHVLYNIFLHPLRSYPGPWWRCASRLPYTISIFRGDATQRTKALHDTYGQVVRISPDTLSYTAGQAWLDVYGLKTSKSGGGNLPKDPKFYVKPPDNVDTISTANDIDHRRLRRVQAHAFSEKAIAQQESILRQYIVQCVARLLDDASKHNGVVDILRWMNYLTTDVIGDLSFGESFGGLDKGRLHPWLETLFTTLKVFTFIREILRLPSPIIKTAMACIPEQMLEHQKNAVGFGADAVNLRISRETDRPDFISYILRHRGEDGIGMSQAELEMAAITFIVAGSETTATMITGTTSLLLDNPTILSELTKRIRSDFPDERDLNNVRLQQHEYLNGVLKEGLRLYPPAPDYLFRTTGDRSVVVAGKMVPPRTSITMNLWAAGRDPANWHRPLEFLPERWARDAPAEFRDDDRDSFRPFSYGPRDCIGKNLAWAEMRMIMAHLVWSIDFLGVEDDSKGWIEGLKIFSLWEKVPLNVKIAPRGGGDCRVE